MIIMYLVRRIKLVAFLQKNADILYSGSVDVLLIVFRLVIELYAQQNLDYGQNMCVYQLIHVG